MSLLSIQARWTICPILWSARDEFFILGPAIKHILRWYLIEINKQSLHRFTKNEHNRSFRIKYYINTN